MSTIALTFSDIWQEAIFGHMMHDYAFFLKCKSHLQPTWFRNPNVANLVKYSFALYDSLGGNRMIMPEELMGYVVQMYPDINSQRSYRELLKQCATLSCHNVGLDILQRDMTSWIRLLKFREAMITAESLFNKGDYDKSRRWLQETLQGIEQATFENDNAIDFRNFDQYVDEMNEQFENCLTTGCPGLDELLIRSSTTFPAGHEKDHNNLATLTKGGLTPGDTTVIMGASNAGKTSMVISVIAANIRMKKNVLYITHEQKYTDIRWRLLECMTGLTSEELLFAKRNPNKQHYNEIMAAIELLDKYLRYHSHTRPDELWVEDVAALIRSQQEAKIAKTGKGFDMLVDDYPGKLRSHKYLSKKTTLWEEQLYIYDQFVNIGRHYNIHVIVPCQTNREGFKITRGDGARMVDQDDVGGAYGIMQLADNVITINRNNQEIAKCVIMLYIAKCRSAGQRHGVLASQTALEYCRTHGFNLTFGVFLPGSTVSRDFMAQSVLHNAATVPSQGTAVATALLNAETVQDIALIAADSADKKPEDTCKDMFNRGTNPVV